jgi:ribosomal protein S3AE
MKKDIARKVYNSVVLAGAAVALSSAIACSPTIHAAHPPRSAAATVADTGTCVDKHVKSIWKGEDISGPECVGFVAYHELAPDVDRRRIQKVCERTQIRTVLTGEAPTAFTLTTCAVPAKHNQETAILKTCRAVSHAQSQGLNPAQLAVCTEHLLDELSNRRLGARW